MKLKLAIEWFLNPDHLPFIVAMKEGFFEKAGIALEIIEPDAHYDGLEELRQGNIAFATNEPLHLIEQFTDEMLTLGTYFETKGGVLLKESSYPKLKNGESITVTTPVSNPVTNAIGFEIIRRYYAKEGVDVTREQVHFEPNGFEHLKYMQEGADAGWLYFYNFEGIEAQHKGLHVRYLDAENAGFANFSALDIFTTKQFYHEHTLTCNAFVDAIRQAIRFIQDQPETSLQYYYDYSKAERTPLMDAIIHATRSCFHADFASRLDDALPVLEFFREIGITQMSNERYQSAFLA